MVAIGKSDRRTQGGGIRPGITRSAGLWQTIREDWTAHGRDWTKPGFRAAAIHRLGVWRMQISFKPLRAPFSVLYRAMYRRVRNHYGIDLPESVKLGRRVIIER